MKIGRIIGRNRFTFIWFLIYVLNYLGYLFGFDYFGHYSWQQSGWFIQYYANKYINWPQGLFFITKDGTFRFGYIWSGILGMAVSLAACITADFVLRKLLWNKKKKIDSSKESVLVKDISKTPKRIVMQIVIWIVKWTGRLFASLSIPFLIYLADFCIYAMQDKETLKRLNQQALTWQLNFAGASVTILGCIIGWRFPLIGAVMMLLGIVPIYINEDQISFGCILLLFDLAIAEFFATWVLNRFFEKTLKKNDMVQL